MNCGYFSRGVSHGVTAVMTSVLILACGVPADQPSPANSTTELTFVGLVQHNTPVLLTPSGEPSLYRVTVDVTVVFRFGDQLETLIVDLEGPGSGRRTSNEFNLAVLAPEIAAATAGRGEVRVPLTIPELGTLQFSVTLVNHNGTRSRTVDGSFTVESALGANDTTQTQATQVGIATEFFSP